MVPEITHKSQCITHNQRQRHIAASLYMLYKNFQNPRIVERIKFGDSCRDSYRNDASGSGRPARPGSDCKRQSGEVQRPPLGYFPSLSLLQQRPLPLQSIQPGKVLSARDARIIYNRRASKHEELAEPVDRYPKKPRGKLGTKRCHDNGGSQDSLPYILYTRPKGRSRS